MLEPAPTRPTRPARRTAVAAAVAVVVAVVAVTAALAAVRRGEVLPGVSVAGVEVGTLGERDARDRLARLSEERAGREVVVEHDDLSFSIAGADVGYEIDVPATVARAREVGRGDGLLDAAASQYTAFFRDEDVAPVELLDDDALRARIVEIAEEVDVGATLGGIEVDAATLTVTSSPPLDGREVDVDAAFTAVRAAFVVGADEAPATTRVDLPVETVPTPLTEADVEAVAEAGQAALDEPFALLLDGEERASLAPDQLAPLLRMEYDGPAVADLGPLDADEPAPVGQVALGLDPAGVIDTVGPLAGAFTRRPVDARFQAPRSPVRSIDDRHGGTWEPVPVDIPVVPSEPGTRVEWLGMITAMEAALAAREHAAEVALEQVPAAFTTQDAEDFGLTHLLGAFTTYHPCCAARVRNIQRLADVVDGALVGPGEQFSINQLSGIRTCAKGYAADGMILNGEIVDVCGGGVSQFGTTTFNAAFFANTQLDAWKAHSFYISRYPRGREATLNYPSPDIDVRFTNTTDHGMLVKTGYTGGSITVSIYGTPDFVRTQAVHGEPYRFRSPSTRFKEDKSLPPGTSRTEQTAASGFNIDITRVTTLPDGEKERFGFTTVYLPKDEIIRRNTSPPPPEPTPTPTPTTSETGEAGGAGDGGGG